MGIVATSLTPPAYSPRKTLKGLISELCGVVFGCDHAHPSYPIDNQQHCPECGAVRDYIRSAQWRDELDRLLAAYICAIDPPSREKWLAEMGQLFLATSDVFIGEWRKGGGIVRKRRIFPPSTGHKLVRLVTDGLGRRNSVIRGDEVRSAAINIAGSTIAEWAVPQLLAIPAVVRRGWSAKRRRAVR